MTSTTKKDKIGCREIGSHQLMHHTVMGGKNTPRLLLLGVNFAQTVLWYCFHHQKSCCGSRSQLTTTLSGTITYMGNKYSPAADVLEKLINNAHQLQLTFIFIVLKKRLRLDYVHIQKSFTVQKAIY